MTRKIIAIAIAGVALISQTACTHKSDYKHKGALEYKLYADKPGKNIKVGDIIEFNIQVKIGDSVVADSRKDNHGQPAQIQLPDSQSRTDWFNALTAFSAGDSGVIRLAVDSIKKYATQPLPPFMKSGQYVNFEVAVVSVKSREEAMQEMKQKEAKQKDIDDNLLQDYFKQNNLSPTKTSSGLYYIMVKEGSGNMPKQGDEVTVWYTGRTLDGKIFDTNKEPDAKHKDPFKFPLAEGAVIPGWDEGVALMKKGGKAKLFIPSPLGYGTQSPGPEIPANAILIFDVEVTDIKPNKTPNAQLPNQQ